jgi:hypothetical protein
VHADGRAVLVRAQVEPVAHLIHHPQAEPGRRVGSGGASARERIADEAPVRDLADDLAGVVPDVEPARGPGVLHRVGGDLADGDDQVGGAIVRQARLPRVPPHQFAHRCEVGGERQR